MEKVHKAGFVNLIGHPNVGKSTLTNALVGERLNIITPKAQTTRHRIFGILNGETPAFDYQLVFSDTPRGARSCLCIARNHAYGRQVSL